MEDTPKYTPVAMLLHWLTVLLVAGLYAVAWSMDELPKGELRTTLIGLHKTLGITVFLLTALRLAWRFGHRPPALPATLPGWQRKLATGVQHLFYLLLFAQPLLGYLSSSFTQYDTSYLGMTLPRWTAPDKALNEVFNELHEIGGTLLLGVIGLHVLGAVAHLRQRDGLFHRILPWGP